MTQTLFESLQNLKTSTEEVIIYGSLGIPINGQKTVEVPSRYGFVYVRLRDSTSEVIQAQNSTVSPIYDLPVTLVRQGNKYAIKGRDTERYSDWGTFSPFLPRHAEQHEFNPSNGGAGDVVFVWGNQFMPLLTMPSGSNGGPGVILDSYLLQNGNVGWKYVGNTGTPSLLEYKPTGSSAVMVLVYLDTVSGNPGIVVGSGSYFANGVTGTAEVSPYIPAVSNPNWLPSSAIRLTSGTAVIGWDNIYDAKQYYAPLVTGSSGSGTGSSGPSLPPFITGSIPYAGSDGILKEDNTKISFDEDARVLWVGRKFSAPQLAADQAIRLRPTGTNASVGIGAYVGGTGTSGSPSPYYNGYRCRGTLENPEGVKSGDALLSQLGWGHDGTNWFPAGRFRIYANDDWNGSTFESRMEWEITPSGSATRRVGMTLYGDSLNIISGTYNINGVPHVHSEYTNIFHDHNAGNGAPIPAGGISAKAPLVFGGHGNGGTVPASSTNYLVPFITGLDTVGRSFAIPLSGVISNLFYRAAGAQPASGSLVIEVFAGAAGTTATGVKITIPAGGAAGTYSDLVNTYTHTGGDLVTIKLTNNATAPTGVVGSSSFVLETLLV